jgi:hypothetical protein
VLHGEWKRAAAALDTGMSLQVRCSVSKAVWMFLLQCARANFAEPFASKQACTCSTLALPETESGLLLSG